MHGILCHLGGTHVGNTEIFLQAVPVFAQSTIVWKTMIQHFNQCSIRIFALGHTGFFGPQIQIYIQFLICGDRMTIQIRILQMQFIIDTIGIIAFTATAGIGIDRAIGRFKIIIMDVLPRIVRQDVGAGHRGTVKLLCQLLRAVGQICPFLLPGSLRKIGMFRIPSPALLVSEGKLLSQT